MKTTINILRLTAKILLVAAPLMVLSGLLTASPFLFESLGFATARLLHTRIVAAVFLSVLFVHSLMGILFIVQRNKRLNRKYVKVGAIVGWSLLFLTLGALFFARPPAVSALDDDGVDQHDAGVDPVHDAGPSTAPADASDRTPLVDADRHVDADPTPDAAPSVDPVVLDAAPAPSGPQNGPTKTKIKASRPPRPVEQQEPAAAPAPNPEPDNGPPPSPTPPEQAPVLGGSRLVRERCARCHGLDRIQGEPHTRAEWAGIVGRMVSLGAQLSDDERRAVIAYLASRSR